MNYKTNLIGIFILGFICILSSCQKETDTLQKVETVPDSVLQFREVVKKDLLQNGFRSVDFIENDVILEGDMTLPLDYFHELYNKKQSEESNLKSTKHRIYVYLNGSTWFYPASQKSAAYITIRAATTDASIISSINGAINKWNQTGSGIYMRFVTESTANITIYQSGWDPQGAAARGEVGHDGNVGKKITVYNAFFYCSSSEKIGVLTHELGHTLGIAHTDMTDPGTGPVTNGTHPDAGSIFNLNSTPFNFTSGDLALIRLGWPYVNHCPHIGTWDCFNCYVGTAPSGTSAFIYGNAFYYTGINGTCPYPGSWWDGAHCYVTAIPSGASPFIYNNGWYAKAIYGTGFPF